MQFVNILSVPIYAGTIEKAVQDISSKHGKKENHLVSATGAHGLIEAHKNAKFRKILQEFYLNLPDGMPNVWIGKWKGAKNMKRCYGPDFFKHLIINTSQNSKIKHFLCGGKEGVAEELKEVCEMQFGNNNVCGICCPAFLPVEHYDYKQLAYEINEVQASIVWIGLSTPKQEEFAYYLSRYTTVDFIICVGAAFDFHTNKVRQAPSWMQNSGLEWFFRFLIEPRRLYRRYFEIVPKYLYLNLIDFLGLYKT